MGIALGVGIIVIMVYLFIRELQIWSILTKNDFVYDINKIYDKLKKIENDIEKIKK